MVGKIMDTILILSVLLFLAVWIIFMPFFFWLFYRQELQRLWTEPMLRNPVVVFESDDWGVGPDSQTKALSEIISLLAQYRDSADCHPVMTLGMILAEPDFFKIRKNKNRKNASVQYESCDLSHPEYSGLLDVIKQGENKRIFSIQIHGMEHFWPDSLMASLNQAVVEQWLFASESPMTENLPPELQSRWCDCSQLPSRQLDSKRIISAIKSEVSLFKNLFAQLPKVVVPPTFVWTDEVVQAYTNNNINIIVTPGRQYIGRDADGKLQPSHRTFYNGDSDRETGALYIVRDVYFEPALGHKAEDAFSQIANRAKSARPALLEMHRFNFMSDEGRLNKNTSLEELKRLLELLKNKLPTVQYVSTEELAKAFKLKDSQYLIQSGWHRLPIWLTRVHEFFQYHRLAKYSGFNFILKQLSVVQQRDLINHG